MHICPTCKTKLNKHVTDGYCPNCSAREINTPPPADPDLYVAQDADIKMLAGQTAGALSPKERDKAAHGAPAGAVSVDTLGIDILLVTHEELAALAAERPEINAALQLGPCALSWRGIKVIPVSADFIDEHAENAAACGRRVARLQPGHALRPGDPRWETLAKQAPEPVPPYWARTELGPWHLYRDDVVGSEGSSVCGENSLFRPHRQTDRPSEAEMCSYCWAIICDTLVSSIDTTEVKP